MSGTDTAHTIRGCQGLAQPRSARLLPFAGVAEARGPALSPSGRAEDRQALDSEVNVPGLLSRVRLGAAVRFVREASWVVGDQALISATNFLGMVLAARVLSTAEFGTYALAYTGLWALNSVQASLVTQPHSVLASHQNVTDYRAYTSAIALLQIALTAGVGLPLLAAGLAAMILGHGPILILIGLAAVAWQAQEFFRRLLYFEGRLPAVVAVDAISFGGQLAAIVGLIAVGQLTVASALLAAAVTSTLGALLGLALVRASLSHRPMPGAISQNVAHGRWLLGAEIGSFICMSGYPFVLAAASGAESVAIYAAATLILNPLNVIWFAAGTALPIRLSRSRVSGGDRAARGELRKVFTVTMPVVGAYCLGVAILGGPILSFLFGPAYADYGWVVVGAAAIRGFGFISHIFSLGLRAHDQTRPIFAGYAAAIPFSLIVGTVLTVRFGIAGALIAVFTSHVIWTAIWARAYLRGGASTEAAEGAA